MNRRSDDVVGVVNFPIKSEKYKSSREGGMFVLLVVHDAINTVDDSWPVSSGGYCCRHMDECFVGSDNLAESYETENFPRMNQHLHTDKMDEFYKYVSIPYLACVLLGSTGWSGFYETGREASYWECKYGDLTEEGKELYEGMKKLYGEKGKLEIQTWLDT